MGAAAPAGRHAFPGRGILSGMTSGHMEGTPADPVIADLNRLLSGECSRTGGRRSRWTANN